MKKILALLLAVLALGGCTSRSLPASGENNPPSQTDKPSEPSAETPVSGENASAQAGESGSSETSPQENPSEKAPESPSQEDKEASDDDAGSPASGVFHLLDSGYQITLNVPFLGIYNEADGGFYISAVADPGVQGIVSYTDDASEVKAIEENITVLNQTLKNDDSVHDFEYDRQRGDDGLYTITFSYRTEEDEVSSKGYNYVLYRQTPEGMVTVMFTCQSNKYAVPIDTVFQSVIPATEEATDPPSR